MDQEWGWDINGQPVDLGGTDSEGREVGYIDESGLAWESLKERDIATTCGRYLDAWIVWNRSGGVLGPEPDPEEFARQECLDSENIEAATQAAALETNPGDPFTQMRLRVSAKHQAQRARLN